MGDIYVYSGTETDFTTMGLVGALTPSEAKFTEETNGASQVELTHPLDEWGRYNALLKGNVLSVPVPVRTMPPIDANHRIITQIEKWKVRYGRTASERTVYKTATGDSKYGVLKANDDVIVLYTDPGIDRVRVKTKKYSDGWLSSSVLTDATTIEIEDNANSIEDVLPAWTVKIQFFRIYEVEKGLDNVKVTARHISYDLLGNVTMYKPGASAQGIPIGTAINGILNNCVVPHEFKAFTNMNTAHSPYNFRSMNPISAFLDPENGIVKKYNCGMVRDNYELYFLNDPGLNRGVKVVYGKNMTGVTYKESHDQLVTRIIPTGKKKDGSVLYRVDNPNFHTGTDWYVDSEHINEYPTPHVLWLNCDDATESDDVTISQCRARMSEQVNNMFGSGVDQPDVTLEVEFVNLGDTEEYKQFKNLENVFLFDYVQVQYPQQNIDVTARVSGISWNVLTDKVDKVTIGTIGRTLANSEINSWQIPSGFDGAKIRDQTITASSLASNSITTNFIQNGSITLAKLSGDVAGMIESASDDAAAALAATSRIPGMVNSISDLQTRMGTAETALETVAGLAGSNKARLDSDEETLASLNILANANAAKLGGATFNIGSATINSSSTDNIVSLGIVSAVGIYVFFFAYQATTAGASSAYIMRYSGSSSSPVFTLLGTLYEGTVARTPILTSAGVLKLSSQTSDGTVRYGWMKIF